MASTEQKVYGLHYLYIAPSLYQRATFVAIAALRRFRRPCVCVDAVDRLDRAGVGTIARTGDHGAGGGGSAGPQVPRVQARTRLCPRSQPARPTADGERYIVHETRSPLGYQHCQLAKLLHKYR